MLRGCILSLLLLTALATGYIYWLDQTLEPPASWIAGGIAAGGVWLCIGALLNARTAWRDWRQVRAAQYSVHLVDGRVAAVSGTIHPVGEPLLAPFSKAPCVICEYDLARPRIEAKNTKQPNTGSDYSGFLMSPCVVRGPQGEVKLLGYPLLEGFMEYRVRGAQGVLNAKEYLLSHEFEDRSGAKIVTVLGLFGELWTDDDGSVQKNLRLSKCPLEELFPASLSNGSIQEDDDDFDEEEDEVEVDTDEGDTSEGGFHYQPMTPKLVEKRVHVGEDVCVIGVYDELRRGLLPISSYSPNRLFRGTAEEIVAQRRSSLITNVVGSLITLAIIHGAILGGLALYRQSPDVQRDLKQRAAQAAVRGDLDELHALVRRGFDVNFRDDEGRTMLMHASKPEVVAYLISQGADVNATDPRGETALILASRFGRVAIVRQLIAAKANVDFRSQVTQLTAREEAIVSGHHEVAEVLRAADAKE
jgi:hypothetical protein